MRQLIYSCAFILLFFIMLGNPSLTLAGATSGLLLWFQIVLPTLLPFFIITNVLIQTNAITYISNICYPVFRRLFHVSKDGCFAILSGFLCGYPIGAKVTADLVHTNHISLTEAKYLLSFCNNTSPAFITSYVIMQQFGEKDLLIPSLFIIYIAPVICSFVFRRFYKIEIPLSNPIFQTTKVSFRFEMLDHSIMNAFENITKVGGYIILFSILISLGSTLPLVPILSILEITNGIPLILNHISVFSMQYIAILALTSFGGVCAIAQTNSMLSDTQLSIFPYIIEKLITTLVTSLLSLLYVMIILR